MAAVAALGLAAIYDTSGDTVAWIVAGVTMMVLLIIGWNLTKESDDYGPKMVQLTDPGNGS